MRQEDQQTYDKTMKQTRGLFDFTQKIFITLPQYEEGTKFRNLPLTKALIIILLYF